MVIDQKTYPNTKAFVRTCRNLALELEFDGVTYFVNGQTEDSCRRRADSIYGAGLYKEIVIAPAKEALCLPR